jgi:O-antigen/teichoic acid export membrane protein
VPERADAHGHRPFLSVVTALTVVKVLTAATGLISGPLLARALGAAGRGDLTAVQTPLNLAPAIIGLGIPALVYRELPRGRPPEEVLGSLAVPLLAVGSLAMLAAVPVADLLAGSRETVRTYLVIGFLMMPLMLLGTLLTDSLVALQRWWAVATSTVLGFGIPFVGTVVLYALGDLTVGWASALTIASLLAGALPAIPMLLELARPVFRLQLVREGLSFGLRSWFGGLALLANIRLDQLLMIPLVSPRILGLYAVAGTLAGATGLFTQALGQPVIARVAAGDRMLMVRAVRVALPAGIVMNLALAAVTPLLLTTVFGHAFQAAVPMAWLLLLGMVPFGTASVLSTALQADGAPQIPSIAEAIALVVTVPGLILLLRPLGGIGAAIVSDVAYTTSFVYQVRAASRRIGVPVSGFLVPTRDDVEWASRLALQAGRSVTRRLRLGGRVSSAG